MSAVCGAMVVVVGGMVVLEVQMDADVYDDTDVI